MDHKEISRYNMYQGKCLPLLCIIWQKSALWLLPALVAVISVQQHHLLVPRTTAYEMNHAVLQSLECVSGMVCH